jgi:hypothetical protein
MMMMTITKVMIQVMTMLLMLLAMMMMIRNQPKTRVWAIFFVVIGFDHVYILFF